MTHTRLPAQSRRTLPTTRSSSFTTRVQLECRLQRPPNSPADDARQKRSVPSRADNDATASPGAEKATAETGPACPWLSGRGHGRVNGPSAGAACGAEAGSQAARLKNAPLCCGAQVVDEHNAVGCADSEPLRLLVKGHHRVALYELAQCGSAGGEQAFAKRRDGGIKGLHDGLNDDGKLRLERRAARLHERYQRAHRHHAVGVCCLHVNGKRAHCVAECVCFKHPHRQQRREEGAGRC